MQRFNCLVIALTILLLACMESLPCRAQLPAEVTRKELEQPYPPPRLEVPQRPSQKSPLEKKAPANGEAINLDLPPLEPGDMRFPINLATALRLSDARPLIVAAAQASAWYAEAELQRAKILWLPHLNLGFDYVRHDGFGPDVNRGVNIPSQVNALGQYDPGGFGRPLSQDINYFYAGGAFFQLGNATDAIFMPLAARQTLNASRWGIQAAKNDALLLTAKAYFNVHKFRGQYAGAIFVVKLGRDLVELLDKQSKDLVPGVEVDRARTQLANLEELAVSARQYWRRSSADLTQILRLDPRAVVEPLENDRLQITLIDPSRSLDDLIPIGLTNRPELAGAQSMVQAAMIRIRQEKLRPLFPVVELNGFQTPYEQLQFGVQGFGNGGKLNLWSFRDDFAPAAFWQAESLGFGNLGRIKEQRGNQSLAIAMLFKMQDDVAAEITQAQARLQSAAARVYQAEREVQASLINFNGSYEGLQQTQRFGDVLQQVFRPQEVVFALKLLKIALDHYYFTVAEYNQWQFALFHALGYPARELAFLRKTGEIEAVDTTRPNYLPPVGTGPPPPSR